MQIVIGYKGLVGGALYNHLSKSNTDVLGLGRSDYQLNDLISSYSEGRSMYDSLNEFALKYNVENIFYCVGGIVPREMKFFLSDVQYEIERITKIAILCKQLNIRLVYFSTAGAMYSVLGSYQEDSEIANHYKALKLLSESILVSYDVNHLIIPMLQCFHRGQRFSVETFD